MSKLPLVVFATPLGFNPKENPRHIGPDAERWLAEEHLTALANSGNNVWDVWEKKPPPEGLPFIAPMFGYYESWELRLANYTNLMEFRHEVISDSILEMCYYHNCGDGTWAGLDEPGSRSDIPDKAFSLGRAYQEIKDTLNLLPGLKPVVTHPADARFKEFGTAIVYAFRLELLLQFGTAGLPAGAEIWAYLNGTDLDALATNGKWNLVGRDMREVGATCLLINTLGGVRKHLVFQDSKGAWQPTTALKALWKGME